MRTTVLEAGEHVGGRTRSAEVEGSTLNLGAAFFASFYDRTLAMCRELEIPLVAPRIHPSRAGELRMMATPSGLVPYAPGRPCAFARFSLVPAAQRLRLLRELARLSAHRRMHIADPASLAGADAETARDWALARIGPEAFDYFVRPAIEPFFYMEAREVSAAFAQALLRHAIRWSIVTPRDGMGAFCAAIAKRLDVRRRCAVRSLTLGTEAVEVEHTQGCAESAHVILAVPAPDLLAIDGAVTGQQQTEIESIRMEPCVVAFFGHRRRLSLPATSVTVGGPGRHALVGVTALARSCPPGFVREGQEIVAVMAMGWRSSALLRASDDDVRHALLAEARQLGVALPTADWSKIVRHPAATVVAEPGFTRRLGRLAAASGGRGHVTLAGDWRNGSSTVESAVRSGLAAADEVLATMHGAA